MTFVKIQKTNNLTTATTDQAPIPPKDPNETITTIVFDTETTGLLKPEIVDLDQQPYIIEIFCTKFQQKGDEIDKPTFFETLILPPIKLEPIITKITSITDEMLADRPNFEYVYPELAKFFTGVDRVVAHNLAFDRGMLVNELKRLEREFQFPWPRQQVCTVEYSKYIQNRRLSLSKLHMHAFGETFSDAHRAKSDVLALVRCYHWLVQQGRIK